MGIFDDVVDAVTGGGDDSGSVGQDTTSQVSDAGAGGGSSDSSDGGDSSSGSSSGGSSIGSSSGGGGDSSSGGGGGGGSGSGGVPSFDLGGGGGGNQTEAEQRAPDVSDPAGGDDFRPDPEPTESGETVDLGGGGGGGRGGGGGDSNQTEGEQRAPDVSDPSGSDDFRPDPKLIESGETVDLGGGDSSAPDIQDDADLERADNVVGINQRSAQFGKFSGTPARTERLRAEGIDTEFVDEQTDSGGIFAETPSDTSAVLPGSVFGTDISEQQLDDLAAAGESVGDEIADTGSGGRQMPSGTAGSPLNSVFGREVADAGGRAVEGLAAAPGQIESGVEFAQNAPLNVKSAATVGATATAATKGLAKSAVTDPADFAADAGVGVVTGTAATRGLRSVGSALPDRRTLTPNPDLPDRSIQDLRGSNRGQFDPASATQTVTKTETRDTTDFETVQTSDELATTKTQQLLQERRFAEQLDEQTDSSNVLARSEQLDESTTPQTQQTLADRRDVGPAQQTAARRTRTQTDVLDFDQQTRDVLDDTTTGATQTEGVVGGISSTLTATETAPPASDTLAPPLLSEETATETPPIVNQLAPTTTQTSTATATATPTQTRTAAEQTTATSTSTLLGEQTPTQTSTQTQPDFPDEDGDESPRERERGVLEGEQGRFNFLDLGEADDRVEDVLDGGGNVL